MFHLDLPPSLTGASLLLLLAACAPGADSLDHSAGKASASLEAHDFSSQLDVARAALGGRAHWYERLEQLDGDHHFGSFGLAFSRRKQRAVWDLETLRSIAQAPDGDLPWPGLPTAEVMGPLQTLVHTARQLEKLGIDFLVVPVPPRAAVFPDWLEDGAATAPAAEGPHYDLGLRELYAQLESQGIEVFDLLPAFIENRTRAYPGEVPEELGEYTEIVFRKQDVHWSSYGSGLAARLLAERIQEYPWAEAVAAAMGRAQLVESVEWKQQYGSIVRALLRRGDLTHEQAPVEWHPHYHAQILGERWSRSDPTSPVVLLGDSFSSPLYSFPQQLLRDLGYRVDLIVVPLGNQSGQLQRLGLWRDLTEKKLVVWQIAAPAFIGQKKWRATDLSPRRQRAR